MEMIKLAALVAVSSCSPAFAQSCFPLADALANMQANGYYPTYQDESGEYKFYIAEDGKGGWVVFAVIGTSLCPIIGGSGGVPVPRKPNA